MIRRFLFEETGTAAIEYALITALIAVPLIASFRIIGEKLSGVFSTISTNL